MKQQSQYQSHSSIASLVLVAFVLAVFFALPVTASILDGCEDHCEADCNDCGDCAHCIPTLSGILFSLPGAIDMAPIAPGPASALAATPDRVFVSGIDRPPQPLLHS